jgi:hypothetical protein
MIRVKPQSMAGLNAEGVEAVRDVLQQAIQLPNPDARQNTPANRIALHQWAQLRIPADSTGLTTKGSDADKLHPQ